MQALQAAQAVGQKIKATWLNSLRSAVLELQDVAVQRFATESARDVAFPAPQSGDAAIVRGIGLMTHDGTRWCLDGSLPSAVLSGGTTSSAASGNWTAVSTWPSASTAKTGSGITGGATGFTVARAGQYAASMFVQLSASGTGRRVAGMNPTAPINTLQWPASAAAMTLCCAWDVDLAAGDLFRAWVWHDAGSSLTLTPIRFSLRQVG